MKGLVRISRDWHGLVRIILISFLILSHPSSSFLIHAAQKDLTINAQSISYDREKDIVEARGSVEAAYQGQKITAAHVIYNAKQKQVIADEGFTFWREDIQFAGKFLDYNVKSKKGKATEVRTHHRGVSLSGKSVKIDPESISLRNAAFDSCGLERTHYHVSAWEINVYPKLGWLVVYLGYFWVGNIPLLPIPTYIYDFGTEGRRRRDVPPLPEVGSNDIEGTYYREKLAWVLGTRVSGKTDILYSNQKGWGGGIEGAYKISREDEIGIELYSRQLINFERVNILPNIFYKGRDLKLMAGVISEESSGVNLLRAGVESKLSYPLEPLDFNLDINYLGYGDNARWVRILGEAGVAQVYYGLKTSLKYYHYFMNVGASPFNFEQYRFNANDKLGLGLNYRFRDILFGVNLLHNLPALTPQEIDYSIGGVFHCIELSLIYRAMRGEFGFGVSLTTPGGK